MMSVQHLHSNANDVSLFSRTTENNNEMKKRGLRHYYGRYIPWHLVFQKLFSNELFAFFLSGSIRSYVLRI